MNKQSGTTAADANIDPINAIRSGMLYQVNKPISVSFQKSLGNVIFRSFFFSFWDVDTSSSPMACSESTTRTLNHKSSHKCEYITQEFVFTTFSPQMFAA